MASLYPTIYPLTLELKQSKIFPYFLPGTIASLAAFATRIFTTVLAGILQNVPKKMPEAHSRTPGSSSISSLDAPDKADASFLIHTELDFQWMFQLPSFVLSPTLKLLGFAVEIFFE